MNQASSSLERPEGASSAEGAPGSVRLETCSARIDDGLLMVFGPEGDPLPPEVVEEAALVQKSTSINLADAAVSALRIANVLAAQRRQRLTPPGGDAWLRSMLGLGPTPDDARPDELASEGRVELIRFAQELVITTPANQLFLLRAVRPDEREAGVQAADAAGAALDHHALLDSVAPTDAADAPATAAAVEPDGTGVVLTFGGSRLRLAPAEADTARSIVCAITGETVDWPAFARALLGTPAGWDGPPAAPGEEVSGHGPSEHGRQPAGPPECVMFDDQGFADLGWLEDALAGSTDRVSAVILSGLPAGVRVSAGEAAEAGWRVGLEDVPGLTMFATPEDLDRFTLEIRPEGADAQQGWSVPVVPTLDLQSEARPSEPLTVPLDFPPPFSARNRLDYFAVVMIEGLPAGATLSAGVPSHGGSWTLAPDDLKGLRAHLPAGAPLPCRLEVVGITIENQEGMLSSARRTLTIGADGPTDDQVPIVAPVDLAALLETAGPDRRVDAVALTGLPPVVELSSGTHDRVSNCWVLRASEMSEVIMTVRDPAIRRLSFKARAIVIDGQGGARAISRTLEVELPEHAGLEPVRGGPGFFRSLADRRS